MKNFASRAVSTVLAFFFSVTSCVPAWAGITVEHGDVAIEQPDAGTTNYLIGSDQAILSHTDFSVAASQTVNFHFLNPTASSSVLNRVTGGAVSTISGILLSNGQVLLINPAGINITGTAQIEVARGLVISTLDISNADFLAGQYRFEQAEGYSPALLKNSGTIVLTKPGGLVALLGGAVQNSGTILAETGSVALVAGEQVTLSFDQQGWLAVAVDQPLSGIALGLDGQPVASAIEQSGVIAAAGGYVLVHASALPGIFNRLVTLPAGLIEANSVVSNAGRIELVAQGGELYNQATLRADGTVGAPDAGKVSIWADKVVQGGAVTSNAAEGGAAGQVEVTGIEEVTLEAGSRLEAKAAGLAGQGGSVRVLSTQPKVSGAVDFRAGSSIDVSGGSFTGDAGFVELSASEVSFDGQAKAQAGAGYTGGRLLVDPLFIIFNALVNAVPPDNAAGTPDLAFGDNPGGTTTIEVADIVGFAEAFFQAVNDITINAAILMGVNNSLILEAGRDLKVKANVGVTGTGSVTMLAINGDLEMDPGTSITSESGDIDLGSGDGMKLEQLTSVSGDISAAAGGNLQLNGAISSTSGDIGLASDSDLEGHGHISFAPGASVATDSGDIAILSAILSATEAELEVPNVTSNSGDIGIFSGRGVKVRENVITGGDGSIFIDGDYDDNGSGTVKMSPTSIIQTTDGNIDIRGGDADMALSTVTSATGDICVHEMGTIALGGPVSTGGDGMITLWADSDKNGDGQVQQQDSDADITTVDGQILLWGAKVSPKDISSSTGDIYVWATDSSADLDLDGLISTGGNVELYAGRNIRDSHTGTDVIAGGDAEFTARTGTIGTSGNAIDVDITGTLDVAAADTNGGVSLNLAGTVGGGIGGPAPTPEFLVTELGFPVSGPVPPGTVLLNGTNVAPLGGPLGIGFDADCQCITGIVPPPPPPPPGPGPGPGPGPTVTPTVPVAGGAVAGVFEVENRRRYQGLII